jgi:hypothetical protein
VRLNHGVAQLSVVAAATRVESRPDNTDVELKLVAL